MARGISAALVAAARKLCRDLAPLRFGAPVTHVYDPLEYARAGHELYLRRFGDSPKATLFLGMNPGPFGMGQTGVPFGDVASVRGWLGIEARVGRPAREHPRRPVQGFACPRGEVSGRRLWGALREHYGRPERFFARSFVANYCPLLFLEASGRNRTPDRLSAAEREALFGPCDRHLRRVVELLEPRTVIGVGSFAEGRARAALADLGLRVGRIPHPSPASPRANADWAGSARRALEALGLCSAGAPRRSP
jgi:single-strand selective monofunctional uracil DNA glycosylase